MTKANTPVQGRRDATVPGCILVDSHPSFPKLHRVPDSTFYRYDTKAKRIVSMVTEMPDLLLVAWDTCAGCAQHVAVCKCKYGIVAGRAIDVIYSKTIAVSKGARWEDVQVKHKSYTLAGSGNAIDERPAGTKRMRLTNNNTNNNSKRLRLSSVPTMKQLDKMAEQSGAAATKKLLKHITASPTGKRLRKATPPPQPQRKRFTKS